MQTTYIGWEHTQLESVCQGDLHDIYLISSENYCTLHVSAILHILPLTAK